MGERDRMKKILWLDDEPRYAAAQIEYLSFKGYRIDMAKTVGEAEARLNREAYDLLILDVAVPVLPEEEDRFPVNRTKNGHETGFLFYQLWKNDLDKMGTKVLVVTSLLDYDPGILQLFSNEGLPSEYVVSNYSLRRAEPLLKIVEELTDDH